ncbi:MAG: VWA domain-containing protein [Dehalococcoidia bacterium]
MRFADPQLLVLVLLIPLFLIVKSRLTRDQAPATFSNVGLLAGYGKTWRLRYRWVPTLVRALALVLLVVAIARPQQGRAETEVQGEGIDIVLVLDTSSSMTGTFGDQDKLESAQTVIKEFIEGREDDRIGFVIFRDRSLVLSPLTLDYDSLGVLVDSVDKVNLPDGTAIGSGLGDALNLLRESKARSRVAILLTDGQNNAGTIDPGQAARIAETLGIRVYTIGMIDPAARRTGGSVNVDEKALEEMARVTGGRYFAADNEQGLQDTYVAIDGLETSQIGRPTYLVYDEIAPYFLVAALFLLVVEAGLRASVWKQAA